MADGTSRASYTLTSSSRQIAMRLPVTPAPSPKIISASASGVVAGKTPPIISRAIPPKQKTPTPPKPAFVAAKVPAKPNPVPPPKPASKALSTVAVKTPLPARKTVLLGDDGIRATKPAVIQRAPITPPKPATPAKPVPAPSVPPKPSVYVKPAGGMTVSASVAEHTTVTVGAWEMTIRIARDGLITQTAIGKLLGKTPREIIRSQIGVIQQVEGWKKFRIDSFDYAPVFANGVTTGAEDWRITWTQYENPVPVAAILGAIAVLTGLLLVYMTVTDIKQIATDSPVAATGLGLGLILIIIAPLALWAYSFFRSH